MHKTKIYKNNIKAYNKTSFEENSETRAEIQPSGRLSTSGTERSVTKPVSDPIEVSMSRFFSKKKALKLNRSCSCQINIESLAFFYLDYIQSIFNHINHNSHAKMMFCNVFLLWADL